MRRSLWATVAAVLSLSPLAGPAMAVDLQGTVEGILPGGDSTGGAESTGTAETDTMVAPPRDFIKDSGSLSGPDFPGTMREAYRVPMADEERLYVEVVRPDPQAHGDGPWPVIMEVSPYHGTLADRDGTRIFPDPVDESGQMLGLTGYFAPRGYAVAIVDLRGTGRSTGCLDHIGAKDAGDLKTIIEWAADQPWSNGRVGLTGHSYVGSTPNAAAAGRPRGLVTIVPSAGLAGMYDHQFQKGVPYLLQWVGPMVAYEQLAIERDLPGGDNSESGPNAQTGCGLTSSSLTAGSGQVTGQYEGWHAERDWREGAATANIPIFMVHGANDNAARIPAAEWFFGRRFGQAGDKVWLGQWDHGSTNGRCGDENGARALHPNCRFDQWKYALHAWFDKHLKGRKVNTGPAVEVFLNGSTPIDVTQVVDPETVGGKVWTAKSWQRSKDALTLYPDATDGSLKFQPPAASGSASFTAVADAVLTHAGGSATFTSAPLDKDQLLVGLPELQLNAAVTTSQVVHLVTTLSRVDQQGRREPMNFCAIQPQLREGIDTITPVVPLQEMALPMQCFTAAHWVSAGQRLELRVSTSSPHHATFGSEPQVTVFTGPDKTRYTLPRFKVQLRDDVPLRESAPTDTFPMGPAQPRIEGSVIVPVSGAGTQVEPLTAASFEFDVEEGFDNARLEALAIPNLPADIDLYLQRQVAEGWGPVLTSAESGSLERELLTYGRPDPGHYRLVVHNWAGAPAQVELTITFFNQNDEPGGGGGQGAEGDQVTLFTGDSTTLPQP
jgi:uncharacterized protein